MLRSSANYAFIWEESCDTSVFSIGEYYRIDGPLEGIRGLSEFSPTGYAVMVRQFEGEVNYNASPVDFLGDVWDVQLGTVNGMIYKVAAYLVMPDEATAETKAMGVLSFCESLLGRPVSKNNGLFLWDASDGNVVVQLVSTHGSVLISVFVTSRAARTFRPR